MTAHKPPRSKGGLVRRPNVAPSQGDAASDAVRPDEPDEAAAMPRSDIEHIEERKLGSVETLPPDEGDSAAAGFVESARDEEGDAQRPPLAE